MKKSAQAVMRVRSRSGICWLTPQETEGPYYFDADLFRQDIRTDSDSGEFHDGLQLNMTFEVIDLDCNPIPNVLVDIWHTDKDGLYSGYVQPGGNTVGEDFMRGIQLTDANGQCSFITSYPGWYPGRATHVHFKVRLSSTTYVTSQFAFLDSINDAVYATPLYVGRGPNPTTNEEDGIFRDPEPEYQIMTVTPNPNTGGYDGTYTIGIAGATGIKDPSDENPDRFMLRQNYPNPFNPITTIPYQLARSSRVKLSVFDMLGREISVLVDAQQPAGMHEARFDAASLTSGFYFYRLLAVPTDGAAGVSDGKEMLLLR
jgi:protocatechuate 3,4-dioxygenase beta subunit